MRQPLSRIGQRQKKYFSQRCRSNHDILAKPCDIQLSPHILPEADLSSIFRDVLSNARRYIEWKRRHALCFEQTCPMSRTICVPKRPASQARKVEENRSTKGSRHRMTEDLLDIRKDFHSKEILEIAEHASNAPMYRWILLAKTLCHASNPSCWASTFEYGRWGVGNPPMDSRQLLRSWISEAERD